jgi:hypothetical protein
MASVALLDRGLCYRLRDGLWYASAENTLGSLLLGDNRHTWVLRGPVLASNRLRLPKANIPVADASDESSWWYSLSSFDRQLEGSAPGPVGTTGAIVVWRRVRYAVLLSIDWPDNSRRWDKGVTESAYMGLGARTPFRVGARGSV